MMHPHLAIVILLCTAIGVALGNGADAATDSEPALSWGELVDSLKSEHSAKARDAMIERARYFVDLGIVKRVYKYEDVGKKDRSSLDGRAVPLEPEIQQTFALAMASSNANATASAELPALAAAYRLTGEQAFKDRTIAQLEEMTTWSPLQLPGWTLYARGHRLPPDGKDGNWLGTGWGVRAIADTFEIMPAGSIPDDLRSRLNNLLAREIDSIADDWKVKRPWFVRGNNAITNQWVLPTEGLVRACLVLGKDKHKDAYELGVRNLMAALDSHGKAGEFEEGIAYANMTVQSFLSAAHHMAIEGDRRAIDHPFLRSFPLWAVHHLQPGNTIINSFDCTLGQAVSGFLKPMLSMFVICSADSTAAWGMGQVGPCSYTLPVAVAEARLQQLKASEPPLFASYERAARVNWRDSWKSDASGVWVRGGHQLDQHDHQDRGHVNYVHKGKPILIEDGTPVYSEPDIKRVQSCEGHNVLQIGDAPAKKGIAPITVSRLDAQGGDVTVEPTACYEGARKWTRRVIWSSDDLEVRDEVVLEADKQEVVTLRWHLATAESVTITGETGKHTLARPDARMTIESDTPLDVTQRTEPQYTLGYDAGKGPASSHTCVVVRSRGKVGSLKLTTRVDPTGKPAR